ncbi:Phage-related minor tail protein [Polystyrenella longa]|uniref:Phage-related minor tail protein n=1 Tax=Polystyrenella longa TaxID=2528007 RepID=A0A518CTZ3_9PLAN|nr:phage tail tape measure protein [Polystyrenella longa]QDU82681.1 Phage-related minor tail protein [Polystyrenella longa]
MADVTLQVAGDSEKAQQELVNLEKKLVKMTSKLQAMGKKSQKVSQESKSGFHQMGKSIQQTGMRLFALEKGYNIAVRGATKLLETHKKITAERNEIGKRVGQEDLKLQIQAGLTRDEVKQRFPQMRAATMLTPSVSNVEEMFQVQTQLHSSGFRPEDLESGRALLAALNLKAATNQFGESMGDVKEVILSISQFRKGMGDASPSAASIESTGGKLTQLFEGSDIQFPHLGELANVAAALKGLNIDENQQLASFSALVDVMGPAESKTGLRQVASRLRGASESEKKVAALESLNLKPEDVDLIGESFITALERLQAAASKVDEKTRSSALLNLFDERGQVAASTLLGQLPVVQQRMKILEGGAYERNIQLFRGSPYAYGKRMELRKDLAQYDRVAQGGGLTNEMMRERMRARVAERSAQRPHTLKGAAANTFDRGVNESIYSIGEIFTGSQPSETTGIPVSNVSPAAGIPAQDINLLLKEMKEGNSLSREMLDELKRKQQEMSPTPINRNAHVER